MFGHDRRSIREHFLRVYRRMQEDAPLEPLDSIIATVISEHPEYHPLLADERALDRDWTPEGGSENPFLHMGMHIAIREQVATDRPAGVRAAWEALRRHTGDPHAAEHRMLECLGEMLWAAGQRSGTPDESAYIACIRRAADGAGPIR